MTMTAKEYLNGYGDALHVNKPIFKGIIAGNGFPHCNDRRAARCFAYGSEECSLLTSTYPADKLCPFFKTQREYEEER